MISNFKQNYFEIYCLFRLILMYNILPETEGRTLEDIEIHFADNTRKLTDHYIVRNSESIPKEKETSAAV